MLSRHDDQLTPVQIVALQVLKIALTHRCTMRGTQGTNKRTFNTVRIRTPLEPGVHQCKLEFAFHAMAAETQRWPSVTLNPTPSLDVAISAHSLFRGYFGRDRE